MKNGNNSHGKKQNAHMEGNIKNESKIVNMFSREMEHNNDIHPFIHESMAVS